MVSWSENIARYKSFLKFTKQELVGLFASAFIFGFIFSFRDWGGDSLNVGIGLTHFLITSLIVGISLVFRIGWQKLYSISQGYKAEFNFWWGGIIASLILTFVTLGYVPLVLIGAISLTFHTRQRLGEFRYGFSYKDNSVSALWAIWASLLLATIFAVGLYFSTQSYFFQQGMVFNLMMAFCALIPLPQLEGLQAFFGGRWFYYVAVGAVLLGATLLLSRTSIGLIIAIILGAIMGISYLLKGSEV